MLEDDVQAILKWWKTVPEDYKRYVIFRHERMGDPAKAEIYKLHRLAEQISKAWKKQQKEKDWE